MLDNAAVEAAVAREFDSLCRKEAFMRYARAGGCGSWQTMGFYSESPTSGRFVVEALLVVEPGICVVRAYQDSPLEILYAAKISNRKDVLPAALSRASNLLTARLPADAIAPAAASAEYRNMMDSISPELVNALSPLPPPCRLGETPEYNTAQLGIQADAGIESWR